MAGDEALRSEDWIKIAHWDIRDHDQRLVTTWVQLAEVFGPDLPHFLTLPAAEAMPPALRAEAERMIAAGRLAD